MPFKNLKPALFILTALLCIAFAGAHPASAQKRDHLNAMEIELVRDAQEIDRRTEIFAKAIDRRFIVLNNDTTQAKQIEKDAEMWGELPSGTHLQLLTDIRKILAEAIEKIDDVAAHGKTDTPIFAKAVRKLAAAADKYLPAFKSSLDKTVDEKEKGAILASIEYCEQIIEASAKVPKEEPKNRSKKDDN